MTAYIRTPFGEDAANRGSIPNDSQPDGSVSYEDGFGVNYELDPGADPDALDVPRLQFNQMMYAYGLAIQAMQRLGFPEHITAADNGGTAYAYAENATVRGTDGNNYYSLIDGNTDIPPSSNWGLVSYSTVTEPTGTGKDFWGTILPSGYVWGNGATIGSAASGATGRANADTSNLFTLLWNSIPNSTLPIQDSAGVASTRGISAAADFSANKRMPVPDKRERVSAGAGTMGGTADPARMTLAGCGFDPVVLAAAGGAETVSLTGNQNGTHAHVASTSSSGSHQHFTAGANQAAGDRQTVDASHAMAFRATTGNEDSYVLSWPFGSYADPTLSPTNSAGTHTHTVTVENSGLGSAHQNTQPTIICNYIIKL